MLSNRIATTLLAASILFAASFARAQQPSSTSAQQSQPSQSQAQDAMPGMKMPASADKPATPVRPGMNDDMHHDDAANPDAAKSAMDAMSGEMNMNAHMFMTELRPKNPQDDARAAQIIDVVRESIAKYKDYRVALADGYQIFLPNAPQRHYHFTNYRYGFEAAFAFDPEHPTSLLYKKVNGTYVLEGAMFTARKLATEDELNQRVPLSVARWHKHVNLCLPPKGTTLQSIDWKEFGPGGSISTEDACDSAGGRWVPQVFGWMVHVYPFESDPAKIWAH